MVPSVDVTVAPTPFISDQKFDTENRRPTDRRTRSEPSTAVTMALKWKSAQRCPHHIVGSAPADADLPRQRAVVRVAEHAALRQPGGADPV